MALLFIFLFSILNKKNEQNWTSAQKERADFGRNITYLSGVEKDIILYINLCRIYPQDFLNKEVIRYALPKQYENYLPSSKYYKTLIQYLKTLSPANPLQFSPGMYNEAKCLSEEQSKNNTKGHARVNCSKSHAGECCSYGMDTGKDIVMQLLIDHNVTNLGHRKMCMEKEMKFIGVSFNTHKSYRYCAVLDFSVQ